MRKVTFVWEFRLDKENEELTVDLNGGCNCIIDLKSEYAHYHLSKVLADVLRWQYDVGNKTNILPQHTRVIFEAIERARTFSEGKSNLYY